MFVTDAAVHIIILRFQVCDNKMKMAQMYDFLVTDELLILNKPYKVYRYTSTVLVAQWVTHLSAGIAVWGLILA